MVGQQACHLAYNAHADLLALPLLALDQNALAVSAKDQIDATIRAAQTRLFDGIAFPTKCLADHLFELAPAACGQTVQRGPGIQQAAPMPGAQEREESGQPTETQQHPGEPA